MATYYIDLENPHYTSEVLSFYLWGQRTPPSRDEIADDKWIGRQEEIRLRADTQSLLDTVSPYVNIKDFKLTEVFFSGKTVLGNKLDANILSSVSQNSNGEYELTQEDFANLFYGEGHKDYDKAKVPSRSISLYNRGLNDEGYAKRAFVFGTVDVSVNTDNVRYILDKNLNPVRIENFDIKIKEDNFDFVGGDGSESINKVLNQVMDPSGIGKKVIIEIAEGAVIRNSSITKEDYLEIDNIEEYNNIFYDVLKAQKYYAEYGNIFASGVIDYLDKNGKLVIFGSNGEDTISGTKAKNFDFLSNIEMDWAPDWLANFILNHYKNNVDNGITYVGGNGNDKIGGTEHEDILLGGKGEDILKGEEGKDTLDGGEGSDRLEGGAGDDKYIANDGDTIMDDDKGEGKVQIKKGLTEYITLKGGEELKDKPNTYDGSNGETYTYDEKTKSLTVKLAGQTITIENFDKENEDGYLGIKLKDIAFVSLQYEGTDNDSIIFKAVISEALEYDLVISYDTKDIGAKQGVHYINTNGGHVTIKAGEKEATIKFDSLVDTKEIGCKEEISEEDKKKLDFNVILKNAEIKEEDANITVEINENDKEETGSVNEKVKQVCKCGENCSCGDGCKPPRKIRIDPIVLDMDKDQKISTVSLANSEVYFDINGDGLKERVSWIDSNEAFLVYDRNQDGKIDSINELFGNRDKNGFDELRETADSNYDNKIDKKDALYNRLQVWFDSNQNGKVDEGELKSLSEAGIKSINLNSTKTMIEIDGAVITDASKYIDESGNEQLMGDLLLEYLSQKEPEDTNYEIDFSTYSMVNMQGGGFVEQSFIAYNTNENFKRLVLEYEYDINKVMNNFDEFMAEWSGLYKAAEKLGIKKEDFSQDAVKSINVFKVWILERFWGRTDNLYSTEAAFKKNTNGNYKSIAFYEGEYIDAMYKSLVNRYQAIFALDTYYKDYFKECISFDTKSFHVYDNDKFNVLFADLANDKSVNDSYKYFLAKILNNINCSYINFNLDNALSFIEDENIRDNIQVILSSAKDSDFYFVNGADFTLNQNSTVFGNSKDDTINITSNGSYNTVFAGMGDDKIISKNSNDTYVYNLGNGNDIIYDIDGKDRILFGKGIAKDDINLQTKGSNLIISLKDGSSITIIDFKTLNNRIEELVFFDGSIIDLGSSNVLSMFATENNDVLEGGDTDDIIESLGGDDIIYANNGNDILVGGTGDDTLYGGYGDDTYIFNKGDGKDTISDTYGNDTLKFGEGITKEDLLSVVNGKDLVIYIKEDGKEYHESKDRIVIKNYVNSGLIENIFLSDGISVKLDELQKVTEGNDYLVYGNSGYIIDALGGNDTIITGSGNDTIYGGKGIDTIDSGDGNDTIYGGDGEDTINSGNGNDIIDGGSGNDTINAGSGNNILIGGKGDDTLNGGYDDDTYIFNRGDGRDIITDSYGTDTISFGENITKDDLIVRLSGNDLIIAIKEEGVEFNSLSDKITIKNYTTSYYKIENILFFDGSRLDTTTILYPTQNDDYLVYSDSAVTVDALDGDDIVITGSGNDTIYGSNGNDKLYGNGGNDVLDGGKGNDLLEGGLGGDTYMFGRGYGKDTVYDNGGYGYTQFNAGIDTLEFKGDIDKDDLWVKIIGKDLIIGIKEEGKSFNELKDVVTIKDYFNANNRIEVIKLGDDTIVKLDELQHGTEGNDNLIFDDENTMVHTLGGDDTVTTGAGDDEIHAGDGNDTVNSNAGNDLIYAGNGNDMVYAGSGNDIIYGENGDDIIYGEDGDDTLIGGAGSDILNGGSGDDTYIFNLADGKDTINDTYGNDTLLFGEGIAKNDIITKASNNDLILYIKEDGKDISQLSNSITIKNFFKSGYIENLELHDGTILKLDEIELGTDANDYLVYDNTASIVDAKGGNDTVVTGSKADVVYGGDGNDTINSNGGNDTVYGGAGNDIINSGTGDDVLFGGQGDDTIYGGLGDDTYVYNIGDGHDTINDEGENDRIIFGEGISKDDLIFKQTGYDLTLALKDGDKNFADLADSIKIVNYFKYQNSIETIIFDDGTTITNNDIAKLFANVSIKDTIFSEQGAVLRGGLGDDTYVYNRGDFTVVIDDFYSKNEIDVSAGNDTLMFGTEITKEDVTIGVNGDNLIIIINDNTGYEQLRDTVVIKDWKNENRGVEKIIFSDGEILLIDKNNAFPYIDFNNSTWTNNRYFIYGNDNDDVQGTSLDDIVKAEGGEDIIYTQNGNDIVYGGDGDDIIDTGVGNDRLIGGKGDDYLKGDAGNDTYIYSKGDGRDFIVDSAGNDVLYFDEGISRDDIAFKVYDNNLVIGIKEGSKSFFKLEDRIIIKDWYGAGRVEKIEFSDGTSLSASDIISAIGTDAGESIRGVDNAPNVINAYGGDDVIRGYNYDDILSGGSGNDTIYGGSGNDIIDGGIGQDMLFGEQGNDTYIFSKGMGHDTVVDNSGLDTIKMTGGLTSSDVVYWRENNDLLIGIKEYGKSIEELNDVIKVKDWYLSQQNRVEIVLFDNGEMLSSNEFLTATENNDNFTLGDENNDFHALSGNDTIYAQSGDDIIYGDDGNDIIYGENGNDTLHGGNNNDTLYGGNDNDTLYGDDGDDTLRGENGNDILDGGNDNDILYGGNGNDIIYGGDGNDTLYGENGDDILDGGSGDDILQGGNNDDTYIFGRGYGKDTITDTNGNDTVKFGENITVADLTFRKSNNDIIIGIKENGVEFEDLSDTITIKDWYNTNNMVEHFILNDGQEINLSDLLVPTETSDNLTLGDNNDNIHALGGDDVIYAAGGDDIIYGDGGNDKLYGGEGNDELSGDDGDDTLRGENGNDILDGGNDNDILYGGNGNDIIYGGDGNDTLYGENGDDILDGGSGDDILQGGNNDDTYIFGRGYGKDTITDTNGNDTVKFADGIAEDDLIFERSGNNLIIGIKEDGVEFEDFSDVVTIINWYTNYRIEYFTLNDGSKIDVSFLLDTSNAADNISFDNNDNVIHALGGDDIIHAAAGNDTVYGDDGNDTLYGDDGNDIIYGNKDEDILYGGNGDDVLDGGEDNDIMYGDNGNDTYIFNRGYGKDTVVDTSGNDTLKFGDGITENDLIFKKSGNDVVIGLKEEGKEFDELADIITLKDWYNVNNRIEHVILNDDTEIDISFLYDPTSYSDNLTYGDEDNVIDALEGDDVIHGGGGDDIIYGGEGNDTLYGDSGNDTLDGGAGNDTLNGGDNGNDTYIFSRGFGKDTVHDYTGSDVFKFTGGITPDDIVMKQSGHNLIIALKEDGKAFSELSNAITLINWSYNDVNRHEGYYNYNSNYGIENFIFDDGTVWTTADIVFHINTDENDVIYGLDGNDTLTGGKGDDTLYGRSGNDTYIFNRGYGKDTVVDTSGNDTLKFGDGITENDLIFKKSGNDVVIGLKEEGKEFDELADIITLKDWYNVNNRIEHVILNDDTEIDISFLYDPTSYSDNLTYGDEDNVIDALEGDDVIHGGGGDDIIYGGEGNDTLYGDSGNDTLDGGAGNDTLNGGSDSDDTYIFGKGYGKDTIDDDRGNDTLKFKDNITSEDILIKQVGYNLVIALKEDGKTFSELSDTITIKNCTYPANTNDDYSRYSRYGIENFVFADGTAWNIQDIFSHINTDENDVIYGLDGNDTLTGGKGDDTLYGRNGNDTYIFNRGYGKDTIVDTSGNDTLKFGDGITENDIVFWSKDANLTIDTGNGDVVTIGSQFSAGAAIETLLLSNGSYVSSVIIEKLIEDIKLYAFENGITINSADDIRANKELFALTRNIWKEDDSQVSYTPPLVLDLNSNSKTSVDIGSNFTYFDYDGDGFRERTAWFEAEDAMLAIDINGNGIIDNGSELFGSCTKLSDGSFAKDGYEALSQYDENGDGIIDKNDSIFSSLKLWKDTNSNGLTDEGELTSIQISNIVSIYLYRPDGSGFESLYENGNIISNQTTFKTDDEQTGIVRDIWFQINSGDTITNNDIINGNGADTVISGKDGDDTYIFANGCGKKVVDDNADGFDTIRFTGSITANDILIKWDKENNGILVGIKNGSDDDTALLDLDNQILIKNWFDDSGKIERFTFENGEMLDVQAIYNKLLSTKDNGYLDTRVLNSGDTLNGGTYGDILFGTDGDEVLLGNVGDDYLSGEKGNDRLEGGNGDDTLDGGLGDDILLGGSGNDYYVFQKGSGKDTVYETSGQDTILIGSGLTKDDIIIKSAGADMIIAIKEEGKLFEELNDTLTIKNYMNVGFIVEKIEFEDGTSMDIPLNRPPVLKEDISIYNLNAVPFVSGTIIASDPEDDTLSYIVSSQGLHGELIINENGEFIYTITDRFNGADEVRVQIIDEYGLSVEKTLVFNVTSTNKATNNPDYILLNNSGNILLAKDGDDLIFSGGGIDIVYGQGGNDTIYGEDGADILYGEDGNDTLFGGLGNDILHGNDGNDILHGEEGNDTLRGEDGNDTLYGGNGNDTLYGGDDNDILFGQNGDDTLDGDKGDDILYGGDGEDTLRGGSGNDILIGGYGDDTLKGESGDDIYVIGRYEGNDTIHDSGGNDILKLGEGITKEDLIFRRSGTTLVIDIKDKNTNAITNSINITSWFISSARVETILFNDNLSLDISFMSGLDSSNSNVYYIFENDKLTTYGSSKGETIYGYDYDDIVYAGDGVDIVYGDKGNDTIYGQEGNDTLRGEDGNDTLYGGNGNDTLYGGDDNDILFGQNGDDTLDGDKGDDTLYGGDGEDALRGGSGNDILIGGYGEDTLRGESGDDIYLFNIGDGKDSVYDTGGYDTVKFGDGITKEDISFFKKGSILNISYGNSDTISVSYQTLSSNRIERFELGNGNYMTNQDIELIIQNINAYAKDNGIQITSNDDIRNNQNLMQIVSSGWNG